MPDADFIFRGNARSGRRAADEMGDSLERLRRRTNQANLSQTELSKSSRTLERDQDRLSRAVNRLNTSMGNFNTQARFFSNIISALKFPSAIAAVGILTQGLNALVAATGALVGALAPLSGTLVAYPALLSAVAQAAIVGKVAFGELGQAIAGNADAMKRLTPEARKFVREFRREIRPLLRDIQKEAQGALLPNLSAGLDQALNPRTLGTLRRGVRGTAGVLGDLALEASNLVGSPAFGRDLARLMRGNDRLIRHMGRGAVDLTAALVDLMIAAQPLTEWMGRLTERFGAWARIQAQTGRETGTLQRFFASTRETLEIVGPLVADFAVGLKNILVIGAPFGRTILRDLAAASESFRSWTESATGRNAIAEYFRVAMPTVRELGRLTRDVIGAFLRLSGGREFTDLVRQIRLQLLPALEVVVGKTTEAFGPHLINLLTQLARAFLSISGSNGPLTIFVDVIAAMAEAFADLLGQNPQLQQLFFTLAGAAAIMRALNFAGAVTGINLLINRFRTLGVQATTAAVQMQAAGASGAAGAARGAASGAALTGFGASAAGASPLAMMAGRGGAGLLGTVSRVASFLGPIGLLAGTAGSLAAAFLLVRDRTKEVADEFTGAQRAVINYKNALEGMRDATRAAEDAQSRLEQSQLSVEVSVRTRNQIIREAIRLAKEQAEAEGRTFTKENEERVRRRTRQSLDYRLAQKAVKDALRERTRAEQDLDKAQGDQHKQQQQVLRRTNAMRDVMLVTNQTFRDRIKEEERLISIGGRGRTSEQQNARRAAATAEVLRDYRAEMRRLAETSRNQGIPRMERYAEAAQVVSRRIRGIPTKKEIEVQMRIEATLGKFSMGVRRAEGVNIGDAGAADAGNLISRSLNAGLRGGMDAYFTARQGDIEGALSTLGSPRADVTPGLWDELMLARSFGLSITSTYRPGSIVRGTNRASLHGMFPARAFDAAGSASQMAGYARAVLGRPGLSEVLYSPVTPISDPITRADHFDHVHTGARTGDAGVGEPDAGPRRTEQQTARLERALERLSSTLDRTRTRLSEALDNFTGRAIRVFDAMTSRLAEQTPAARELAGLEASDRSRRVSELQQQLRSPIGGNRAQAQAELEAIRREDLATQAEEERRQLEVRREEQRLILERRLGQLRRRAERGQLTTRQAQRRATGLLSDFGITPGVAGDVVGTAFVQPFRADLRRFGQVADAIRDLVKEIKEDRRRLRRGERRGQHGGVAGLPGPLKVDGFDRGFDTEHWLLRPGEVVLPREIAGALARGGGVRGVQVIVPLHNPVFLGTDRQAGEAIARVVEPHLGKVIRMSGSH